MISAKLTDLKTFKGILNLFSYDSYKINITLTSYEIVVHCLIEFIAKLYEFKYFGRSLFFFHLVFYSQIFVSTKIIILNYYTKISK